MEKLVFSLFTAKELFSRNGFIINGLTNRTIKEEYLLCKKIKIYVVQFIEREKGNYFRSA